MVIASEPGLGRLVIRTPRGEPPTACFTMKLDAICSCVMHFSSYAYVQTIRGKAHEGIVIPGKSRPGVGAGPMGNAGERGIGRLGFDDLRLHKPLADAIPKRGGSFLPDFEIDHDLGKITHRSSSPLDRSPNCHRPAPSRLTPPAPRARPPPATRRASARKSCRNRR